MACVREQYTGLRNPSSSHHRCLILCCARTTHRLQPLLPHRVFTVDLRNFGHASKTGRGADSCNAWLQTSNVACRRRVDRKQRMRVECLWTLSELSHLRITSVAQMIRLLIHLNTVMVNILHRSSCFACLSACPFSVASVLSWCVVMKRTPQQFSPALLRHATALHHRSIDQPLALIQHNTPHSYTHVYH